MFWPWMCTIFCLSTIMSVSFSISLTCYSWCHRNVTIFVLQTVLFCWQSCTLWGWCFDCHTHVYELHVGLGQSLPLFFYFPTFPPATLSFSVFYFFIFYFIYFLAFPSLAFYQNSPTPFLGQMSWEVTEPGFSLLYLLILYHMYS